ncbi:MAG: hypothetical protein LVQ64_06700 [Thermoplasmatales archaeon]|nr:hypothetical protein [Thermoplasmatales archaeon]
MTRTLPASTTTLVNWTSAGAKTKKPPGLYFARYTKAMGSPRATSPPTAPKSPPA